MADWIGINSSHIDSYCGHGDNQPLSNALDGTGPWYHYAEGGEADGHFFIIDLGKSYHISQMRGRSNTTMDPNDIDVYISDDKENWGSRVLIGITSWANRTSWAENGCVEKSGRYIKVDVQDVEGSPAAGQIQWGGTPSFTIFDAYGYIAVTLAGSSSTVSGASGSLIVENELQGSAAAFSSLSGYMDINSAGGESISLAGSSSGIAGSIGDLDISKSLMGSLVAGSACSGLLDAQQLLTGLVSAISGAAGVLDVLTESIGTINTVSNLLGDLSMLVSLSSLSNGVAASSGALCVGTTLASSITCESNTVSELDVDYAVYTNPDAEKWYDMIQRLGVEATVTVHPVEKFNPLTQNTAQHNSREFTVKVIPPYKNREGYSATEMITTGVGLTGIANFKLEFVVKVGMKFTISSKVWTVTGIQEIKNNTGILVYILEIDSGN